MNNSRYLGTVVVENVGMDTRIIGKSLVECCISERCPRIKGIDIEKSGTVRSGAWCRDMGNNETPRKRLDANEMRMLRWLSRVTEKDKFVIVCGSVEVE